jgi:hypothetical protein
MVQMLQKSGKSECNISQREAAGFLRLSDSPDIAKIGHDCNGKKLQRVPRRDDRCRRNRARVSTTSVSGKLRDS